MARGLTDALHSLGLAGEPTELRSGLAVVLREDDAENRWLRGQDVFTKDRQDPERSWSWPR
jgi:hypothetical protein